MVTHSAAVVVLHYKNCDDTLACLDSLYEAHPSYRVIVVANAASPGEISRMSAVCDWVAWIPVEGNVGFSAGNTIGMQAAFEDGCQHIILLNNDTVVPKGFISSFIQSIESKKFTGLVSPKIYFAPHCEYHADRYTSEERGKVIWYAGGKIDWSNVYASHRGVDEVDTGQYNEAVPVDFATGCCMYISRAVIQSAGFFDEKYFLYYEDVDYSVRAKRAGFEVFYDPSVHIWHKNAASSDAAGSLLHRYYQTRNRLYFGYKYAPARTKKSLLIESMRMLLGGGVEQRAVADYYFRRMGKMYETS